MPTKTNISTQIKAVLNRYIKSGRVFIFGSQANKSELILADIDLGFESDTNPSAKWLKKLLGLGFCASFIYFPSCVSNNIPDLKGRVCIEIDSYR